MWGDVHTASHEIAAEGIETAAIAHAFTAEIAKNEIAVLSAITAGGIEALVPWPAARTVTIAADRDEAKQGAGLKRGERAARRYCASSVGSNTRACPRCRRVSQIERHVRLVELPQMPRVTCRRPLDG